MNLHHSTLLVKFSRVFAALNPSNFQGNWSLHEMKIVQRTSQVLKLTLERGRGVLKGFWLCHDKNYLIPYKALWYSYEQHPHLHYPSILCWRQLISPSVIPTTLPPPPPPSHTHTRTILHLLLGQLRLYDWSLIRDYNFSNLQEITFEKVFYPIHVT